MGGFPCMASGSSGVELGDWHSESWPPHFQSNGDRQDPGTVIGSEWRFREAYRSRPRSRAGAEWVRAPTAR